ncbi:hypothetical protein ACFW9F_29835 [Streptomyces sp. NPDC059506]|uniref:hypothetical protein n=1 Tax=Streptomyces sp. NPDC059506 TaxID=3347751 RepID=UPI00367377AA
MSEKVTLSILSIESVVPGGSGGADSMAVCVVRCIEGTAHLGMVFQRLALQGRSQSAAATLILDGIEWYGKQVDQLDTVHSGKVTLTGAGADGLAVWDVLNSVPEAYGTT